MPALASCLLPGRQAIHAWPRCHCPWALFGPAPANPTNPRCPMPTRRRQDLSYATPREKKDHEIVEEIIRQKDEEILKFDGYGARHWTLVLDSLSVKNRSFIGFPPTKLAAAQEFTLGGNHKPPLPGMDPHRMNAGNAGQVSSDLQPFTAAKATLASNPAGGDCQTLAML